MELHIEPAVTRESRIGPAYDIISRFKGVPYNETAIRSAISSNPFANSMTRQQKGWLLYIIKHKVPCSGNTAWSEVVRVEQKRLEGQRANLAARRAGEPELSEDIERIDAQLADMREPY